MDRQFEIAGGSITGRDHLRPLLWRNNQDGFHWAITDKALIALVVDGCGSSLHSEVGAKLGVRIVIESVAGYIDAYERIAFRCSSKQLERGVVFPFWEEVRKDVLARLRILAKEMDGNFLRTVNEYFLFSLVGALITSWGSSIFSIGDGVFFVNGEMTYIGPFSDNAPPYLAYGLIETSLKRGMDPDLLEFKIHQVMPTFQLNSLLIGTDGAFELTRLAEENIPGKEEKVGPISQFWQDDRYFANFDQVRRRLALLNKSYSRPDWANKQMIREQSLLPDDTTIIVIRRKKIQKEEV